MSQEIFVTYTAGFAQNMWNKLVAAYHSIFEEVTEADVLIHIVDGGTHENVIHNIIHIIICLTGAVENLPERIGERDEAMVIAVMLVPI